MRPGLVIVRRRLLWVAACVVLLLTAVVMLRLLLLLVSRPSMMSATLGLVLWRLLVAGPSTGPRPLGLGVTRGDHTLLGDGLGHRGWGLRGAVHRPRRARVAHDDLAQWSVSLAKAILLMSFHYIFLMIVTNSKTHFLSNILYYHCLKAFLLPLIKVMS